ncbi:MAG: antibiotic biosynthesis monooxygenase [Rhodobacteraceae bacterium]|nr:MAG: antibiotic biosynthesis monooxygenase [Paracoccaceae bacterium]
MIAVIFEVTPGPNLRETYLDHAALLRPELAKIEGFVSVERFESLVTPGKLLSLSIWEDEAAVKRWRNHVGHRTAQKLGRERMFADYRIRVAGVIRDYVMDDRSEAPEDSLLAL